MHNCYARSSLPSDVTVPSRHLLAPETALQPGPSNPGWRKDVSWAAVAKTGEHGRRPLGGLGWDDATWGLCGPIVGILVGEATGGVAGKFRWAQTNKAPRGFPSAFWFGGR